MSSECLAPDCIVFRLPVIRGLCWNCYHRYLKQGKPCPLPPSVGGSLDERIARYTERVDDCLIWRWKTRPKIQINGKKDWVARLVWEQANGPIPTGGLILHRCGNNRCVNVDHLYLGDYLDNARDTDSHGRQARGTSQGQSKLTDNDIRAIRKDNRVQRVIAMDYGVCQQLVSQIKRGRIWTHVPD